MDLTANNKMEKDISVRSEGKLFVHRHFHSFSSDIFSYSEQFYTVKGGIIFIIEGMDGGKVTPSGDTFINLVTECKEVGIFDPLKKYPAIHRNFDYGFIETNLLNQTKP